MNSHNTDIRKMQMATISLGSSTGSVTVSIFSSSFSFSFSFSSTLTSTDSTGTWVGSTFGVVVSPKMAVGGSV